MKLRTKKWVGTLVAAFMVVLLAGSAFAFIGRGLTFRGTASVAANLELVIVGHDVTESAHAELVNYVVISPDRRTATWTMNFTLPQEFVYVTFDIQNVGTIDAAIAPGTGLTVEVWDENANAFVVTDLDDLLADYGIWVNWVEMVNVIPAGAPAVTDAMMTQTYFFDNDFQGYAINTMVRFTYRIAYTMAG